MNFSTSNTLEEGNSFSNHRFSKILETELTSNSETLMPVSPRSRVREADEIKSLKAELKEKSM